MVKRFLTLLPFERASLVEYVFQKLSLSFMVQKLWPRLNFFCHRTDWNTQTRQKLDAPNFYFGCMKHKTTMDGMAELQSNSQSHSIYTNFALAETKGMFLVTYSPSTQCVNGQTWSCSTAWNIAGIFQTLLLFNIFFLWVYGIQLKEQHISLF